jgi:tetratricopeptide (TPR) repeat protein
MRLLLLALLLAACSPAEPPDSPATGSGPSLTPTPVVVSLLGTDLFPPVPDSATAALQSAELAEAQAAFDEDPDAEESAIWLGRRTAYMWNYRAAIQIYTEGLAKHPNSARLLRHRGHRYLSVREFDQAIEDFVRAAELTEGTPDEVEPDGQPNAAGIPTGTLQTNIWYHLGLAYFFKGEYVLSAAAMQTCFDLAANNDMRVAAADWLYLAMRRAGMPARQVISFVTPDLPLIENTSYLRRILMYRGLMEPDSLLGAGKALDLAVQGYGVGSQYLLRGDTAKAVTTFQAVLDTGYWSAFGYIAAEADLARMAPD